MIEYLHMATRKRKRAPGAGRPPAGIDGAKVADYPAVTVRFEPNTLRQLKERSAATDTPLWRLVDQACKALLMRARTAR